MNYQLNEKEVFSDVTDGIAVIINLQTGIYYGMNAFSTNVYENIIAGVKVEDILSAIHRMAGAPEHFDKDFKNFIDEMIDKKILIQTEEDNKEPKLEEQLAKEDSYSLVLKEFVDAQELLLADPIHEVKEDMGWTPEKESIGYTKEETRKREEKGK